MGSSALRASEVIRQARREGRCGYIGRAAQRSGRPPARNPEGRALLRRGFVEGLARSACYATSPFSCPRRKIAPAQTILPRRKVLWQKPRLRHQAADALVIERAQERANAVAEGAAVHRRF